MKVNYNAQAIIANNKLAQTESKLSASTQRLSSGFKIVKAKDNPAGLAMSRRMNMQIESLGVANNSSKDGVNIIKTTDGVLSEVHAILQRMNELSVKASTDAITENDRDYIQEELTQLKDEITRISNTADFNGQSLLDGTFDLRGYATVGGVTTSNVKVCTYTDDVPVGDWTVTGLGTMTFDNNKNTITSIPVGAKIEGPPDAAGNPSFTLDRVDWDGNVAKFSNAEGMEIQLEFSGAETNEIKLELTGTGAMTLQVGANEGQILDVRIPKLTLSTLGIYNTNFKEMMDKDGVLHTESEASRMAIEDIKGALDYVSKLRSRLGAYQNRLEHTTTNIDTTVENMTTAYSQIMDVDMGEEMVTYSTQQVLEQAGTSILSQANERSSLALQLLE